MTGLRSDVTGYFARWFTESTIRVTGLSFSRVADTTTSVLSPTLPVIWEPSMLEDMLSVLESVNFPL